MSTIGRLVIVGEAPGPSGNREALNGDSGKRLARLAGLDLEALLRVARTVNVLDRKPAGPWPRGVARAFAKDVARSLESRRVLLLGQRVADAFRLRDDGGRFPLMLWTEGELYGAKCRYAVMPHPSGLNRWYNDGPSRARAATFLVDALGLDLQAGLL